MTKDDLIFSLEGENDGWGTTYPYKEVEKAMDLWAKQQSIAFGDWIKEEMWYPQQHLHRPTTWRHYNHDTNEGKEATSEQLYELFLKQQNENK